MHPFQSKPLVALVLLLFVGCAAAPQLENYPYREIDRPHTLPKGLATWSTLGACAREWDNQGRSDDTFLPVYPLVWRKSLSDRWDLTLAPIPVAASYQFHSDEKSVTGLNLGYGLYLSSGNSTIGPAIEYFHRQKFTRDFALEFTPQIQPWVPIGENARWDVQAGTGTMALWQVADRFALRAGFGVLARRDPRLIVTGGIGDADFDVAVEHDWRVTVPLRAGFTWALARQWDLHSSAALQKIGEGGYSAFHLAYELRHYW